MSLTPDDVTKIARLAHIELSASEAADTLYQLNGIFSVLDQLSSIDTEGVAPLSSAVELTSAAAGLPSALRLRDDAVSENNQRENYQKPAPAVQDGLYLVPRVIGE